ncbi:WD40/YVTN/BNR-like repeat-containing protein [Pontibacter akesuensis]|uniref:WD40/YVTN/BNR-like repeat-containing protein n=1 Tax=Pontibacter akesuensis TaxID=388950 RepID=UPI00083A7BE0|nr:hypothetical protein [Pontibacter akesuensis]
MNPEIGLLISSNQLDPFLTADGKIIGVGSNHSFYTENDFKSFQTLGQLPQLPGEAAVFKFFGPNTLVAYSYVHQSDKRFSNMLVSRNYGRSWESYVFESDIAVEKPQAYFNWSDRGALFSEDRAIIIYQRWPDDNLPYLVRKPEISLFQLNPKTGESIKLHSYENAAYGVVDFFDAEMGGFLMSRQTVAYSSNRWDNYDNAYVSFTNDGGLTWTAPVLLDDSKRMTRLFMISKTNVIVQSQEKVYFTDNLGQSWQNIISQFQNRSIDDLHFLGEETGFALAANSLYKSADGGKNWTFASNIPTPFALQNIQFVDELRGIASGGQVLYKTMDGGQTWRVLLYPYAYVME